MTTPLHSDSLIRLNCSLIASLRRPAACSCFALSRISSVDNCWTLPAIPSLCRAFIGVDKHLAATYLQQDHTLFWNAVDLERKLALFKDYYNHSRTHASLDGNTPAEISGDGVAQSAPLHRLWSNDPPDAGFVHLLDSVFHSSEAHVMTFPNPYTGGESSNTMYLARKT